MIGKETKSSRPVPVCVVKEALKGRSEESELNYEQNATYEYVKKFSKISKGKGEKLLGEIEKVVNDPVLAVKIIDVMPESIERLRLLIPKGSKIEEQQLQEIVKITKKYEPKPK